MKSVLLIMVLAAAATVHVLGKDVPNVVEVLEKADGDDMPDVVELLEVANGDELAELPVERNEIPAVFVTDEDELIELTDEADVPAQTAVDTRRNLSVGSTSGATLIYNKVHRANGIPAHAQMRQITIRTNRSVRAVRVNRVGNSQGATPSIAGGGIGSSFVTIRIRSAVGRGYNYRIQVYAR